MSMSDAMAFEAWQSMSMRERNNLLRDAKKAKNKRRFNQVLSAMVGGPWAIAGLASSFGNGFKGNYVPYQPQYQTFQKDDDNRPMPKKEIVQRKKKQIRYTEGMAATSLGGAGLIGAGAGAKKAVRLVPSSKPANWAAHHSGKLKGTGGALFGAGAVVGGLANINNTKIQQDDLKRHYPGSIKKGDNIMKAFDPEASRQKRAKIYTAGGIGGGAALLASGAAQKENTSPARGINSLSTKNVEFKQGVANAAFAVNRINPSKSATRTLRLEDQMNRANAKKPISIASATKGIKRAKLGAGAALIGLGAANEYHRRHGGKPY